jgi:hypothetical protein
MASILTQKEQSNGVISWTPFMEIDLKNYRNKKLVLEEMKKKHIFLGHHAEIIAKKINPEGIAEKRVRFVSATLEQLGFNCNKKNKVFPSFAEIQKRIEEFSRPCPKEFAFLLRLKYLNQPLGETMVFLKARPAKSSFVISNIIDNTRFKDEDTVKSQKNLFGLYHCNYKILSLLIPENPIWVFPEPATS